MPSIRVVDGYMLDKNDPGSFFRGTSDHALVRVEFRDLVIYSLNILNGEDLMALNFTTKGLFRQASASQNQLIKGAYRRFNTDRVRGILHRVLDETEKESKPSFVFLQEVSPKILELLESDGRITQHFRVFTSRPDVVGFAAGGEFNLKNKPEYRATLVPRSVRVAEAKDMPLIVEDRVDLPIRRQQRMPQDLSRSYKTQLLVRVDVKGKEYNLLNVHVNWATTNNNFVDFFRGLDGVPNLIAVGDFNRPLSAFRDEWQRLGMHYLSPDRDTFITAMGVGQHRSARIDQCLYRLERARQQYQFYA